ncbi:hypothetical protein BCR32DRAFT_271060 [Anaeromyces robustus]|nr:hypothetical protein BCR32DRAFT_251993 [Anaeromyces robustus]ORX76784.1 hypothetical protein BCR32DRAFT_271060 [Anaeromyces robustus]|eukprot:ORX41828.1 hypothetical protein BCR32DRAFT_251993 [Anaeromyces robustus]
MDEEYKKKEKSKLSKLMAQERLKKQVEDLEEYVAKKIQPYIIIDENIIINDLPLLKKWVSSKTCKIVIPLNVISTIDIQKHGNSKISSRAREAIRFLEQYSIKPTKYLKVQKDNEKCGIDYENYYLFKDQEDDAFNDYENDDSLSLSNHENDRPNEEIKNMFTDNDEYLPNNYEWNKKKESDIKDEISESITYYHKHTPSRKYKLLIECIKYFNELAKNEIAQIIDINNNDNETIYPLILVTNNKILTKYREIFQIDCMTMTLQEFIKYMAKKRQDSRKE